MARGLMSCRLPIGVATMKSVPMGGLPVESITLPVTRFSKGFRMLHVSLRSGQVCAPRRLAPLLCVLLGTAAPTIFSQESVAPAASAAALASAGRHLEAAAQYEKSARRGFFSWDADLALLAAREYAAAGEFEEADRMLGKARRRVRDDESRTLLI